MSTATTQAPEMLPDAELDGMSFDGLLAHFRDVQHEGAQWIKYAAKVWGLVARKAAKERRDVSRLQKHPVVYYPRVDAGQTLPETVFALIGEKDMLAKVANYPVEVQRSLVVDDEPVEVVTVEPDGKFGKRMMSLTDILLTPGLAAQVFTREGVRSEAQQIALLTTKPTPTARKSIKVGRATYDRGQDSVRIGRELAPAQEVIDALKKAGRIPM